MKKNITKIITFASLYLIPIVSFALTRATDCTGNNYTLRCVAVIVTGYFQVAINLIIALAVVTFIWNVYRYFFTEKDKKEAGMYVLYSTIGFFIILSLWGLVWILKNSFNLPDNKPENFPSIYKNN